ERKSRRADENLPEVQVKELVTKLEVVPPFDPVEAVFELPIGVQESCRKTRSEIEVAADIHCDRTCGDILRHIDPQFTRVDRVRLELVRGRTQHCSCELVQEGRAEGVSVAERKVPGALIETFGHVVGYVATRREWVEAGIFVIVVGPIQCVLRALGPV